MVFHHACCSDFQTSVKQPRLLREKNHPGILPEDAKLKKSSPFAIFACRSANEGYLMLT